MNNHQFKTLRLSLNLTQRGMAKAMGGINYRTVQRFESGEQPIERMALKLCEYMEKYGVIEPIFEILDFELFYKKEGDYVATTQREICFELIGWNKCLKFLKKKGYKIVREVIK